MKVLAIQYIYVHTKQYCYSEDTLLTVPIPIVYLLVHGDSLLGNRGTVWF